MGRTRLKPVVGPNCLVRCRLVAATVGGTMSRTCELWAAVRGTAGLPAAVRKTARFTATVRRTAGFPAIVRKTAGLTAAGLTAAVCKTAGLTAAGLPAAVRKTAGLTAAGLTATVRKTAGFPAIVRKTAGLTATVRKTAVLSVAVLGLALLDARAAGAGTGSVHGPVPPPAAGQAAAGAAYAWPLLPPPVVLTPFAAPDDPFGPGHRGVDLAGAVGQAVLAARGGTVVFAGPIAGLGVVSVQHDDGLRTTYEPVVPTVRAGAVVAAGDILGTLTAGHRGCPSTCLHWGVLRDRHDYVDPLVLLLPPHVRLLPVPQPWPDG